MVGPLRTNGWTVFKVTAVQTGSADVPGNEDRSGPLVIRGDNTFTLDYNVS